MRGTAVSSVVKAREAARSTPRSALNPWKVSSATPEIVRRSARVPRSRCSAVRDSPRARGAGEGDLSTRQGYMIRLSKRGGGDGQGDSLRSRPRLRRGEDRRDQGSPGGFLHEGPRTVR